VGKRRENNDGKMVRTSPICLKSLNFIDEEFYRAGLSRPLLEDEMMRVLLAGQLGRGAACGEAHKRPSGPQRSLGEA
jgi:hypothetical protein